MGNGMNVGLICCIFEGLANVGLGLPQASICYNLNIPVRGEAQVLEKTSPPGPLGDLDPETFRIYGKQVVDWIADYLAHPERYPVLSRARPGEVKSQLPAAPPASPESMQAILNDFERIILPGVTHWNHPSFFAYFAISGSMPGILGEMLSAALNVNAMLWRTSPAATELEEVTLGWLRQMVGLPESFEGMVTDTASVSSFDGEEIG